MRGLVRRVGSGLSAKRPPVAGALDLLKLIDVTSGSGNFTAARSCVALIYAFGPGGSGASSYASGMGGGGGGAAAFKCLKLNPGQSLAYVLGVPGGAVLPGSGDGKPGTATTVRFPNGVVMTAAGGSGGTLSGGGAGGIATGGDLTGRGEPGAFPRARVVPARWAGPAGWAAIRQAAAAGVPAFWTSQPCSVAALDRPASLTAVQPRLVAFPAADLEPSPVARAELWPGAMGGS